MPYLWLAWLQGDVTMKGVTGSLYVNPYQVLEHLERTPCQNLWQRHDRCNTRC